MTSNKCSDLYNKLYNAYIKRHGDVKNKAECQRKVNEIWKEAKTRFGKDKQKLTEHVDKIIIDLDAESLKKKAGLLKFWSQNTSTSNRTERVNEKASASTSSQSSSVPQTKKTDSSSDEETDEEIVDDPSLEPEKNKARSTPAQQKCKDRIQALKTNLMALMQSRDTGFAEKDVDKKIAGTRMQLEAEEKLLKRKTKESERQRKLRATKRARELSLAEEHPEAAKLLKVRSVVGRPAVEVDQDGLLDAIIKIATVGSGADSKRRSDLFRTCKTLDNLHQELQREGFHLSRSATYLRLLPKNAKAGDGPRHITTVPVKLVKASADEHRKHPDTPFAIASIRYLECLASLLGPEDVFFLSQDDKARVPLGITAAVKQAPMLMHLDYRVRLSDHDFAIAPRHKLIPSVYGAMEVRAQAMGQPDAVSYSGPTYVAIRSGKHSSSTASTHSADLHALIELGEFRTFAKDSEGYVKPIIIISVDGGPDENPRYTKTLLFGIQHFRDWNLDGLFVVCNAPGRSAFNRVERRMAPLSTQLSGLVLPYDTFGTHLDSNRRTKYPDLELKNFEAAGNVLAEVWSDTVIDGHPVVAQYVPAGEPDLPNEQMDQAWMLKHVRQSQYLLQIIKCGDVNCCSPFRSKIKVILPDGFLPAPFRFTQKVGGLAIADPNNEEEGIFMDLMQRLALRHLGNPGRWSTDAPYDVYCPSIRDDISGRVCKVCSAYFPSKAAAKAHQKALHKKGACVDSVPSNPTTKIVNTAPLRRSTRIIARRQNEILVVTKDSRTGAEDMSWTDEEDAVGANEEPMLIENDDAIPLAEPISDWLANPFTDAQ